VKRMIGLVVLLLSVGWSAAAVAAGVERLYILNCGEGVAGDISRWSPGVNEGQSMAFVDNCYLVKHAQGWFLWDTGIPDAVAEMPDGLPAADPKAVHWYRPKTLAAQFAQIGVTPSDIKAMAVSHTHPDHIGNVELFPQTMLYVQKAEYEWPGANGAPRFNPSHPVTKLEGDHDVFGDGSVTILSTPGHTPGHQSLFLKLPKTGNVLLSGDLYHYPEEITYKKVPNFDTDGADREEPRSDRSVRETQNQAQLWIQHDYTSGIKRKIAPAFYY